MVTDINKWIEETPITGWNWNLAENDDIVAIINNSKDSLLICFGNCKYVLCAETYQVIKKRLEGLKLPVGSEGYLRSATLIVTEKLPMDQWALIQDFLHVPGFKAYTASSPGLPWKPVAIIADGMTGIIGYGSDCTCISDSQSAYREFSDVNIAHVVERMVLHSPLERLAISQMKPTTSYEESHDVIAKHWLPDYHTFINNDLRREWSEAFKPEMTAEETVQMVQRLKEFGIDLKVTPESDADVPDEVLVKVPDADGVTFRKAPIAKSEVHMPDPEDLDTDYPIEGHTDFFEGGDLPKYTKEQRENLKANWFKDEASAVPPDANPCLDKDIEEE